MSTPVKQDHVQHWSGCWSCLPIGQPEICTAAGKPLGLEMGPVGAVAEQKLSTQSPWQRQGCLLTPGPVSEHWSNNHVGWISPALLAPGKEAYQGAERIAL